MMYEFFVVTSKSQKSSQFFQRSRLWPLDYCLYLSWVSGYSSDADYVPQILQRLLSKGTLLFRNSWCSCRIENTAYKC
uniref:Uncharacterized protein n=1 Tax=Arundo donax TaxID=35708 RepID=A0A0A8YJI2_ARUDO